MMKFTNFLSTLSIVIVLTVATRNVRGADYLLVVDSSGSMQELTPGGITKAEAAKQALNQLQEDLAAHQVGIMLFGHTKNPKQTGCCSDIEFALPIGPVRAADWENVMARFVPKGSTPLAESLERSKYVMMGRSAGDEKYIVLVTDGNETCGGDPAVTAKGIRSLGINVITHVVGFGVSDKESSQLRAIATAGGGEFRSASDVDGLIQAIAVVTKTTSIKKDIAPPTKQFNYPELSPIDRLLADQLKDKNRGVRNQAAKTLQKRNSIAAVPHLMECVASDTISYYEDKDTPLAAVTALAPERVVETILSARKSKNATVRTWSISRLSQHGGKVADTGLSVVDQAIVDSLLTDVNRGVRNEAAKALQSRKVVNAAAHLVTRVQDEMLSYYEDKDIPLNALKELAPSRVEEALVGAMQSKNAQVRTWAAARLVPDGN